KVIGERFSKAGLDAKIQRDVNVHVPVTQHDLKVPFAFQNGRFNLIAPVRFQAKELGPARSTACNYAVEGRSLYAHRDEKLGGMQLLVVGSFGPKSSKTRSTVRRVLEDSDVKLFTVAELPELIDEIQRTGKDVSPVD
ncbi:MAG: hypothetical protein N2C14_25765, partial [Planctomycetales bacterium]